MATQKSARTEKLLLETSSNFAEWLARFTDDVGFSQPKVWTYLKGEFEERYAPDEPEEGASEDAQRHYREMVLKHKAELHDTRTKARAGLNRWLSTEIRSYFGEQEDARTVFQRLPELTGVRSSTVYNALVGELFACMQEPKEDFKTYRERFEKITSSAQSETGRSIEPLTKWQALTRGVNDANRGKLQSHLLAFEGEESKKAQNLHLAKAEENRMASELCSNPHRRSLESFRELAEEYSEARSNAAQMQLDYDQFLTDYIVKITKHLTNEEEQSRKKMYRHRFSTGSASKDKALAVSNDDPPNTGRRCYNCDQVGHLARTCPKGKKRRRVDSNAQKDSDAERDTAMMANDDDNGSSDESTSSEISA